MRLPHCAPTEEEGVPLDCQVSARVYRRKCGRHVAAILCSLSVSRSRNTFPLSHIASHCVTSSLSLSHCVSYFACCGLRVGRLALCRSFGTTISPPLASHSSLSLYSPPKNNFTRNKTYIPCATLNATTHCLFVSLYAI